MEISAGFTSSVILEGDIFFPCSICPILRGFSLLAGILSGIQDTRERPFASAVL